ncbi:MAG: hypothetical protein ABJA50_11710 [Chloroflexota bacterium]
MESKQSSNLIKKVACKILHKGPVDKQVIADESSDLSYEDALLDVQLTSFFRTEYAKQEPPSGVFPRIIQAIRLNRERQERLASAGLFTRLADMVGQKLVAAYRFGARADSGRVLSGGLLTALLLIAAWPSLSGTLSGNNSGTIYDTYFQTISNNVGVPPTQSPTNMTGTSIEPFQATPPTSTSANQPPLPAGGYISPGRIYDEPLLRIEQRTGENLQAPDKSSPVYTQPGADKTRVAEPQDEQQYQRPALGQD